MIQTPTLEAVIQEAMEARILGLHTMMPGVVVDVDYSTGSCTVQPSLQRLGADGNPATLPNISNCPIGFYRAGNAAVYLPIKPGAKVEIRFCERSIDLWLTQGGTVSPADKRKHHLSDAVVYPGLYDRSDPPEDADPDNLIIINGDAMIAMSPDGKFAIEGATDEAFTVLASLIDKLVAATLLDPISGSMPSFDAATIVQLQLIKTKLVGLTL